MPFLAKVVSFWRNLFRRRQVDQDLNEELRTYVDEMSERKVQAGMSHEAAREAVLSEVGGIDRIKEEIRRQRIGAGAARKVVVLGVLGLVFFSTGVGATVAVIRLGNPGWVDRVLFRPPLTPGMRLQSKGPEGGFLAISHERPAPTPGVEGVILDSGKSGKPVANRRVLLQPRPKPPLEATTDANGHFAFQGLAPGEYFLDYRPGASLPQLARESFVLKLGVPLKVNRGMTGVRISTASPEGSDTLTLDQYRSAVQNRQNRRRTFGNSVNVPELRLGRDER